MTENKRVRFQRLCVAYNAERDVSEQYKEKINQESIKSFTLKRLVLANPWTLLCNPSHGKSTINQYIYKSRKMIVNLINLPESRAAKVS